MRASWVGWTSLALAVGCSSGESAAGGGSGSDGPLPGADSGSAMPDDGDTMGENGGPPIADPPSSGGGPAGGGAQACTPTDKLDLLFVIDNSSSMQEEQVTLAAELPRLVQILATGDRTPGDASDNEMEGVTFDPVQSLHIAVTTTNMGAVGNQVPGCMGTGDDGRFISATSTEQQDAGCEASYPAYLALTASDDAAANTAAADALGADFACVAQLGVAGCGLEQQLEASLKALLPSDATLPNAMGEAEPVVFHNATSGHGDGPHAGFLRSDSVIGVVIVTDEDDCSIPDTSSDLFNLIDGEFDGEPLNLRCGTHSADGTLHPIERYSMGLKSLRPDRPEQVVFAAIAGIPAELDEGLADGSLSVSDVLASEAMMFRPDGDPDDENTLPVPSCDTDNGRAFPPIRIVQTAEQFNEADGPRNGVVRSICRDDYGPAVDAIIEALSAQLGCLI